MRYITVNQKILIRTILEKHGCTHVEFTKAIAKLNSKSVADVKQAREEICNLVYRLTGIPILFALTHPYSKYALSYYSTRKAHSPRHAF